MSSIMDFRLLGPVEVLIDDKSVPLSAPRQKTVLALLLAECGKVVSVARMVDALWPEDPPPTARSQIQITISALRRLIGGDVILTRSPGYLIEVPAETIDLNRFERLVADATAAAGDGQVDYAVRLLRSALAIWSGQALEGLRGDVTSAMAARLNERRMYVLQKRVQFELQIGRHSELIGELREYVAGHPLNEGLRGLLALALYRAGRQSDALHVLREGRELLADEMGLDPAGESRRLEHAILTADPRLDLTEAPRPREIADAGPASMLRQLPRPAPHFTGRDHLMSEISRLISPDAVAKTIEIPVVVLTGPGGIGKTALAVRSAHLASGGFPDGQLFLQFRSDAHRDTGAMLVGLLRLAGFHPDLIPPDPEGRAGLYRSWLAGKRMLIVADGVVSTSQVMPFLPGVPGCAVIVTCRHRMTMLEGAARFAVGPLDELSAFDLLTHLIGRRRVNAEPRAVTELIALCDGVPVALCAAGEQLAAKPHCRVSRIVAQLTDRRVLAEFE